VKTINYTASPTIARFHASNAPVRGLLGPIGSGKSVGCVIELLTRAQLQAPSKDGIRRTRWAIIRQTYPELKSTTIKTWQEWVPESVCPVIYDTPIRARMKRGDMDMEVYFLAIERPEDVRKLLSLELTGVFVNEAREMPKAVVDAAFSRTGRYPSKSDCPAGITWAGMIMDTNPPDDDHWWYKLAEQVKPSTHEFFKQPGALIPIKDHEGKTRGYEANPAAENVQHHQLGYQYWLRLTEGMDPEWVKVMCCGQYGNVFDGKPVYDGLFSQEFHVSDRPLGVFRGLPIRLGWDYGLTPACIVGQTAPNGQLRILREYVCERGGIKQFTLDVVRPELNRLFAGMGIGSTGDPAGGQASQADEKTCFQQQAELGIQTSPAPTNDFIKRRDAVIDRLTRNIDGQPAFIIDPSCKMLIQGFRGGYRFKRVRVVGEDDRFRNEPDKNRFSHPHDALQYLVQGADTVQSIETRRDAPLPGASFAGYT
jgi:hypothetical protein